MNSDFLVTMAQVIPVLLLALVYETGNLRTPSLRTGILTLVPTLIGGIGETIVLDALFTDYHEKWVGIVALCACGFLLGGLVTDIILKAFGVDGRSVTAGKD
jgi:hypothetical protein